MRQASTCFCFFLGLTSLLGAADSALMELIMPDAQMVMGANIGRIVKSPIGKNIANSINSQAGNGLPALIAASGFDPARDLHEILIASTGTGKPAPVIIAMRGSFNAERLATFAAGNGGRTSMYQGVPILVGTGKAAGGLAVLEPSIAVMGQLDQVQAAIRRRSARTQLNARLSAKISSLSEAYDLWAVSLAPASALTSQFDSPTANAGSDFTKSIQQFSGGIRFTSDFELTAEVQARTAQDAQKLGTGLQTIAAMLQQQNQQASCPDCLKVAVEDSTVRIMVVVPEAIIQKAMAQQAAMQRSTQARTMPAPPPPSTDIVIQSSPSDMGTVKIARP